MDGDDIDGDAVSLKDEEENLVADENQPPSPRFHGRANVDIDQDNEDTDRQTRVQASQKLYNNSCAYLLFRSTLLCGMGYRMDNFRDSQQMDTKHQINLEYETQGLAVGVNIGKMVCYGAQIVGIVKPLVRVHLVSIETGLYIKSRKLPPAAAVTTRPCTLKNSMEYPSWGQELILDANYCDVANEDALLLFEILDDKPSLSPHQRNGKNEARAPTAKRVAWAYLLPIGMRGELNVGLSDDWKTSKRNAKSGNNSPTKTSKRIADEIDEKSLPRKHIENDDQVSGQDTLSDLPSDRLRSPRKGEDSELRNSSSSVKQQQQNKRNYPWNKRSADRPFRLQLHFYREYDGAMGFAQRRLKSWPVLADYVSSDASAYPNGIPEVYLQWRLQRRRPVGEGFLTVSLGPRPGELMSVSPVGANGGDGIMRSPSNDKGGLLEADDAQSLGHQHGSSNKRGKQVVAKTKAEIARIRAAVLRRFRGAREPCVVPEKLLHRLDVGPEGAMVVTFSQSGHLLAVCAKAPSANVSLSNQAVIYSLKLFDTDTNEEVWSEDAAHHGVIYDAKWSKDDRYLLTCSGDGTCKIWDLLGLLFRTNALQQQQQPSTGGQKLPSSPGERAVDRSVVSESNASLQGLLDRRNAPPSLLHTLVSTRPVFIYCAVFQENSSNSNTIKATFSNTSIAVSGTNNLYNSTERLAEVERSPLPRVITGSSDGRLCVWDGAQMAGYVSVKQDKEGEGEGRDLSPHEGQVNSIVIDERSKYMISADSTGDILAWRCDVKGWYQLLRKFKRDSLNPMQSPPPGSSGMGGVLSLVMHPDKSRGQMLALSKHPAQLKMYNMSTYKVQSHCSGYVGMSTTSAGGGAFSRAALSADGRYVICGSSLSVHSSQYRLQVWDSQTGHAVKTPLSDYLFPYPIRSISWHPKQHLFAIAMVGADAAVAVYVGDKERCADKVSHVVQESESTGNLNNFNNTLDTVRYSILDESILKQGTSSSSPAVDKSLSSSSSLVLGAPKQSVMSEQQQQRIALLSGGPGGKIAASDAVAAVVTPVGAGGDSEQARLLKAKKAKEMLSRLKKNKAEKASSEADA